jgi:heat shock protein HslJ
MHILAHQKRRAVALLALVFSLGALSACAERVSTAPDPWGANDVVLGVGNPAQALVGTTWVLRALDDDSMSRDTARTLRFEAAENGALSLSTTVGCNRISGRAQALGSRLRVDALMQTKMACADPLGSLEARYAALLAEAGYFGVRGDTLWVHNDRFTRRARYEARR